PRGLSHPASAPENHRAVLRRQCRRVQERRAERAAQRAQDHDRIAARSGRGRTRLPPARRVDLPALPQPLADLAARPYRDLARLPGPWSWARRPQPLRGRDDDLQAGRVAAARLLLGEEPRHCHPHRDGRGLPARRAHADRLRIGRHPRRDLRPQRALAGPLPYVHPQRPRSSRVSQRTKPPFRADQVGSLLRSGPVKEARTKRATNEITPAQLKAVEDAEIKKLVAKQEAIGLQAVTDGEFRRSWWHYDFLSHLDGVELVSVAQGLQFKGTQTKAEGLHVHGKLGFSSHPMIEHFKYLKSVAKAVPKMTIPSPTALHFRGGRQAIEKSVYPTMEPFFDDLGKAYTQAVRAFGE